MYAIEKSKSVDKYELGRKKILSEFETSQRFNEDLFEKTGLAFYELKEHVEYLKIPEFIYPVITTVKNEVVCIMDSRKFHNAHGEVLNAREYKDTKVLSILTLAFETNNRDFMGIVPTLSLVYANWVTGTVKQLYSLDTIQEETLKIHLSFYYTQRMLNKSSKDSLDYTVKYLKDAIKLPSEFIYDALEKQIIDDQKTDLDVLLKAFAEIHELRNFRMTEELIRELSAKTSWFGTFATEISGLAIDYPPALLLMVAASAENNIYKRTKIGTVVDNLKRNKKLNFDLVRSLTKELVLDYGA
jgi:hypothetical protein